MSEHKESLLSENPDHLVEVQGESKFDGLDTKKFWAYGVGHFINDLASTCWFNYLLYFLSEIVGTPAAPWAMLSGQIADGIATPIVGQLSDKTRTRFGQRKPWYVFGLVLVICTFLPTFQNFRKWTGNTEQTGGQFAYYIIFPSLFNVGWAALQISHMSLVPSLTCSRKRRDRLNNLRNSFTFISNFTVLAIALILFTTMSNNSLEFGLLSYIVVGLGLCASLFFIFNIDEVTLSTICKEKAEHLREKLQLQKKGSRNSIQSGQATEFSEDDQLNIIRSKKTYKVSRIKDWFKLPAFYIFGFCYMGVRLYSNLMGSLLSFYLLYVLGLGDKNPDKIPFIVALIPLLIYLSSVITSFALSRFYEKFGRKSALMTGGVLCVINAVIMVFLSDTFSWPIYILAFLIGIAQSMVLATGINMISEVIGTKGQQGAFVFGIYSLLDKFSAGIAIFFITNSELFKSHNANFIRYMTVVVPSAACICACLIVFFTPIQQYSKNTKNKTSEKKRKSSLEEELVV